MAGPTRAVIFVPEPGGILATIRCMEHCASREYDVVGIVRGDWAAVVDMVRGGVSDVVVVDRPDHIDPAWTPRIEVVADHPPVEPTTPAGRPARRRRPRRVT